MNPQPSTPNPKLKQEVSLDEAFTKLDGMLDVDQGFSTPFNKEPDFFSQHSPFLQEEGLLGDEDLQGLENIKAAAPPPKETDEAGLPPRPPPKEVDEDSRGPAKP